MPAGSTCLVGGGGGVVPGTTDPSPLSPTSTGQPLTGAELAGQTGGGGRK